MHAIPSGIRADPPPQVNPGVATAEGLFGKLTAIDGIPAEHQQLTLFFPRSHWHPHGKTLSGADPMVLERSLMSLVYEDPGMPQEYWTAAINNRANATEALEVTHASFFHNGRRF